MTLTDREIFIFIATSIQHALVLDKLDKKTQTRILIKMVEKFCPNLKWSAWKDIFESVENIKQDLRLNMIDCIERKDFVNIAERHLEIFNLTDKDYEEKAKNLKIDNDRLYKRLK